MRKNMFRLLSVLVLIAVMPTAVHAASGSNSWYVKRNGTSRPGFPSDAEDLREYECYFIDDEAAARGEHKLYITFDAGYENGNVARILDVLRDEDVPAAFFLLDNIIMKNTDLVVRMADEGHLVCNHTKRHKNLASADSGTIAGELSELEDIYREYTGREMARYFRFPEGTYSKEAVAEVCRLGYKTVFWSFGYEDWDNARQPSAAYAKNKILSNTHDGAVILLHPTSATNADILRDLIREWRQMGYSFGTLDELTAK